MTDESAALRRFRASTMLDFDAWKDGMPYDLAALDEMSADERAAIAVELSAKSSLDWRDVEALQRIGSPPARARLKQAGVEQTDGGGAAALALDVDAGWTPELEAQFISKLAAARHMQGAFDRLLRIAEAHPTEGVRQALFDLATGGHEDVRYAYGAFLLYLAGRADDSIGLDSRHRPHLLALQESGAAHDAAVAWLAAQVQPARGDGAR